MPTNGRLSKMPTTKKRPKKAPAKTTRAYDREARDSRYAVERFELALLIVDGKSFREIATTLKVPLATVHRWAHRPETLETVAAEGARREQMNTYLRVARQRDAEALAWKVATGQVKITSEDQREMLRWYLGKGGPYDQAGSPAQLPAGGATGGDAPLIQPGTTVNLIVGQAPPTPAIDVGRERLDDPRTIDLDADS